MFLCPVCRKPLDDGAKTRACPSGHCFDRSAQGGYVNLLRTQTETMSAALAGVHSIVVTPFDAVYEQPTDFSERIARNQQLLKCCGIPFAIPFRSSRPGTFWTRAAGRGIIPPPL